MAIKRNGKVIKLGKNRLGDHPKLVLGTIGIAVILGFILVFMPNAYKISINGEMIGAIKDKRVIDKAKETVITQLKEQYKSEVKFEQDLETKKYHAKVKDYIAPEYLISCMRKEMNILIQFKELYVDGEAVGIISSEKDLEELKKRLKERYFGNQEVEVEFAKKVETKDIFAREEELIGIEKLVQKCMITTPKTITYTVKAGDSLSGIASKYNTTMESIVSANPGFTKGVSLKVGQVIKAHINEPLLPIQRVANASKIEKK